MSEILEVVGGLGSWTGDVEPLVVEYQLCAILETDIDVAECVPGEGQQSG